MCGPFRSTTRDANRFYLTFTDDYSRYGYIYLIKHKSETFENFKEFKQEVENQLGRKIKMLRSDRGLISQGDSGRQIDLEEIQEPSDEGTSNAGAQPEEETLVEPIDKS